MEGLQSAPTHFSVQETRYVLSAAVEEHIDLLIHLILFLNHADYLENISKRLSAVVCFQEVDNFFFKNTHKYKSVCPPRKFTLKIFKK